MFFHSISGHLPLFSAPPPTSSLRCISKRTLRLLPVLTVLGTMVWYLTLQKLPSPESAPNTKLPPLYQEYRDREDSLPHYDLEAPYPNGRHAKYLLIGNHQQGVGWGNVLQEVFLNAFLAYNIKRSFVFYNYEWSVESNFSMYNDHLIPSTIPLSALLSGPLVGEVMHPPGVPRAISVNHFRKICSNRTVLPGDEIRALLQGEKPSQILTTAVQKLGAMEDRCIEIPRETWQIWNYLVFGSKDVLELWPALKRSPMITQFGWSPLIHSAFDSNRKLFEPWSLLFPFFGGTREPSTSLQPIPGLLAVHLRRGDFSNHCEGLGLWSSDFNGFNKFDELPDKFQVPPGGAWGENTPENMETYRRRCYPSIPQIVEKVLDVRRKVPGLACLYIMTNGDRAWLVELTGALQRGPEKWNFISSSRDLTLTWEQKFVAHALDMYVAQRAHAFIGNGWSSLTSNTVMLRMGGKHNPNTTFFW